MLTARSSTTLLCSVSVFLLLCTSSLPTPASALFCWQNLCFNKNCPDDRDWRVQLCNTTDNEVSCLAQYRLHNGVQLPSYFGCHTTNTPCNYSCHPSEGQKNDFSCCCSGDLCNSLPRITPSGNSVSNEPEGSDLCKEKRCSGSCVVHDNRAQCYCDSGYVLDDDGITCVDLNECAQNNGGCEVTCHNEDGTGFHCGCHTNQVLKDKVYCQNSSGLICYSQQCDGQECTEKVPKLCRRDPPTPNHCQATYKRDENGVFSVRLLSCFAGYFRCEDACTPTQIGENNIYHCCCDGDLCNGN